ncbi:MAG: pilus assembly protein PilM [Gammaproteobacteria bacterium]|nr:pilus assembly protein PilM [Gammaproteobacteria bacterium]
MFSLLKKKVPGNTLAAVNPAVAGISVARIRRETDLPPVLDACRFVPVHDNERAHSLSHVRKEFDLDAHACVSVVEPGSYHLLLVEAPDVQPAELRAAIRWRIKDLIDFHVDDAVIDVFEVPNQKTAGRNSMMYAVVARTNTVKERIDKLVDAGINLTVVDIPELALRNIAALLPEDVGGVASLYLEARIGLITITRQGILYLSRQIDLGYEDLFVAPGEETLAQDQADQIIIEIQRSLDYYESHFSQPAVASVVIMPLGTPAAGVVDYLNKNLDLQVRELDLNQLIDMSTPLDRTEQSSCLLAVGAALREEDKAL